MAGLALGLAVSASSAQQKEVTVSVLSAPFGTATYVLCSALEQISKKEHPWLRVVASETPGFVFNLKKLDVEPALRKTTVIGSGPALIGLATQGQKPFDKKYAAPKLIGNINIVAVWLASLDDKLKGGADVGGKRLALGKSAQINWAVLPRAVVENGWGAKTNVQYLGPKPAIAALLDGKADLAIVGGYVNPSNGNLALAPPTLELVATGRKLNHLSFGTEAVKKTVPKGYRITPYTVKAGSVQGLGRSLETFIDTSSWTVDASFPEDIAYELAKLIIKNIGKFGEYHAMGKLMSAQGLVYGWDVADIHPGALKAYKEAGIIK
ncbi:MAG: TAXI family TRAP transporter solute-binding subunit [Hyphomicrobiaceae bacterium]